ESVLAGPLPETAPDAFPRASWRRKHLRGCVSKIVGSLRPESKVAWLARVTTSSTQLPPALPPLLQANSLPGQSTSLSSQSQRQKAAPLSLASSNLVQDLLPTETDGSRCFFEER